MKNSTKNPDITVRFHGGNKQSNAANASKTKAEKQADGEKIFGVIAKAKKGLTCDEYEQMEGTIGHQSASPRFTELKKAGRIFVQGTRPTRRGRSAGVHFVRQAVAV